MIELERCPNCDGEVEWSNCRDLDIQTSFIECTVCQLRTFHVDSMAFINLPNVDYISTALKYNAWCKTNPKFYGEERFD